MREWHLITSEYPPQFGGVSHYTHLLAAGLAAAGDAVHVWCPPCNGETPDAPGVVVHRELGYIVPPDLRRLDYLLNKFSEERRLLVQWVPHGYGYRAMNLPFCLWLWKRAAFNHDRVEIMAHEPHLAFEGSWKQYSVAVVHRIMTIILLRAARRVWISIPAWQRYLRPYTLGRPIPFAWLPLSSNVPLLCDPKAVSVIRARYAPSGGPLVGHYGTFGTHIRELLMASLPTLLRHSPNAAVLLMGPGDALRDELIGKDPCIAGRVHTTGTLTLADSSLHLSACDLILQPYPDGVTTRRTTVIAGLSLGLPIVTTTGHLTEPLWSESKAVALTPIGDVDAMAASIRRLLENASERSHLAAAAEKLYQERFDVRHTIAALREAARSDRCALQ